MIISSGKYVKPKYRCCFPLLRIIVIITVFSFRFPIGIGEKQIGRKMISSLNEPVPFRYCFNNTGDRVDQVVLHYKPDLPMVVRSIKIQLLQEILTFVIENIVQL